MNAVLVTAGVVALMASGWFWWRLSMRRLRTLESRLSAIEAAWRSQPTARVRFEYCRRTHVTRLHVTNYGGSAEFRAALTVGGGLAAPLGRTAFAPWEGVEGPSVRLGRGQTGTLELARLNLDHFPFGQWRLLVIEQGSTPSERTAAHASVIGGRPEDQAPTLVLEVSILAVPELLEGVRTSVIALHPFAAVSLVPLEE